jgi:hypothetical protein
MSETNLAWYRHPMMWLVIFPPLASVVAGIITMTLIIKHPDRDVRMQPTVIHSKAPAANSVVPPAE